MKNIFWSDPMKS